MPYEMKKEAGKPLFTVVTKATGKKHSNKPISKQKAEAQKRILESAEGLDGGALPTDAELDKMTKPQLLALARTHGEGFTPSLFSRGVRVAHKRDVILAQIKTNIADRIARHGREKLEEKWDRDVAYAASQGDYQKEKRGLVVPELSYNVENYDRETKKFVPTGEIRHTNIDIFLLPQLKALAKSKGLKGYATMKKADLIAALSPLVGESKSKIDPQAW